MLICRKTSVSRRGQFCNSPDHGSIHRDDDGNWIRRRLREPAPSIKKQLFLVPSRSACFRFRMEHVGIEMTTSGAAAESAMKGIREILNVSSDSRVAQAAIDVQTHLLALEAKLKSYEDWDSVKINYEPVELIRGLIVYRLKADANTGEPPHYICPRCYQRRQKSFLLRARIASSNFSCGECKFEMLLTRPERQSMARTLGGSWT